VALAAGSTVVEEVAAAPGIMGVAVVVVVGLTGGAMVAEAHG
jgi:hypothetical protein